MYPTTSQQQQEPSSSSSSPSSSSPAPPYSSSSPSRSTDNLPLSLGLMINDDPPPLALSAASIRRVQSFSSIFPKLSLFSTTSPSSHPPVNISICKPETAETSKKAQTFPRDKEGEESPPPQYFVFGPSGNFLPRTPTSNSFEGAFNNCNSSFSSISSISSLDFVVPKNAESESCIKLKGGTKRTTKSDKDSITTDTFSIRTEPALNIGSGTPRTSDSGFIDIRSVNSSEVLTNDSGSLSGSKRQNHTHRHHVDSSSMEKVGGSFSLRNIFRRRAPGFRLFNNKPSVSTSCIAEHAAESMESSTSLTTTTTTTTLSPNFTTSTTGLILQPRPPNVAPKSDEEETRHRRMYESMIADIKKKEQKDARRQRKQEQLREAVEDKLAQRVEIWNREIIPSWANLKDTKKTRELWQTGLPPSVRGRVWNLALGNELNVTPELYEICLDRASQKLSQPPTISSSMSSSFDDTLSTCSNRENTLELIRLDVSRTFPNVCIFQAGGPYHDPLHRILSAYVCYRPDIGYVQGMSSIAAVLLLNMPELQAFLFLSNLLNKPLLLTFYRMDEPMMIAYYRAFDGLFRETTPKLHDHFTRLSFTPDLFLMHWIMTIFTRSLSLDAASQVWDLYLRDGDEWLFRVALGILRFYEEILLNLEFTQLAQFLLHPPPSEQPALFRCIHGIGKFGKKFNNQIMAARGV